MTADTRKDLCDMHSHILPKLDDGSKSSAETLAILRELYAQGVGRVVATPHFYASKDEPGSFLKRREGAAAHIAKRLDGMLSEEGREDEILPRIYLGAEVEFFNAISLCPELDEMCIRGTRYLLVEMPFEKWTGMMLGELYTIKKKRGITPIIAHIDRYSRFFSAEMLDEMIGEGLIIQCNAEVFLSIFSKGRALKLLEEGKVHLLGSDCHNMDSRAPRLYEAVAVIEKKLGAEPIERISARGAEILEDATPIWLPRGERE